MWRVTVIVFHKAKCTPLLSMSTQGLSSSYFQSTPKWCVFYPTEVGCTSKKKTKISALFDFVNLLDQIHLSYEFISN